MPSKRTVIETYQTRRNLRLRNEWRWRMIAAENGKIICQSSEGYSNAIDLRDNVLRVTGFDLMGALERGGRFVCPERKVLGIEHYAYREKL